MFERLSVACAVVIACLSVTVRASADSDGQNLPTVRRRLPQYTEDGEVLLPKNFHQWIHVGSPLTPNALKRRTSKFSRVSQRLCGNWVICNISRAVTIQQL